MSPVYPQQDQAEAALGERLKWGLHFLRKNLLFLILLGAGGIAGVIGGPASSHAATGAEASLVINTIRPQILSGFKQINDLGTSRYWLNTDFFNTQFEVLKSRNVARRVVKKLALHHNAMFMRGVKLTPTADPDKDPLVEVAVDKLTSMTRIVTVKQNRVVRIQIVDEDPDMAQRIANTYVLAYKQFVEDKRLSVTAYASRWLRAKVKSLSDETTKREKELKQFREKHRYNFETKRAAISVRIKTLMEQLTLVRRARFELSSRNRDMGSFKRIDDLFKVGHRAVISSQLIQSMKMRYLVLSNDLANLQSKYLDKHPAVVTKRSQLKQLRRRMHQEVDNIRHTVRSALQDQRRVEAGLLREIRDAQREDVELEVAANEHAQLLHGYKHVRGVYERVKKQLEETELTSDQKITNIRILDWAKQPKKPIYPKVPLNLALGLALGLFLGLVGATLRETLNTRVQRIAQVEDRLALPFLGLMPYQRHLKSRHDISAILALSRSEIANFCRLIRTNLERKSPRGAKAFVVTSPNPREGKTVMTVTLAVTMASGGKRTIIIDADMFKPRVHRIFSLDNSRGLANYLRNPDSVDWRSLVRQSPVAGLEVICAGTTDSIPTDLLEATVLARLVDELSKEYDCILFDTPPVLSTSDAMVLSSFVNGVIFVLNSLRTSFDTAEAAKKQLERSHVEVTGVVLNKINRGSIDYKYYYKTYEQQAYLPQSQAEVSDLLPVRSRSARSERRLLNEPATPTLLEELSTAAENFDWELQYQPVISLESASVVGFEALIRWRHHSRGVLMPREFISLAEQSEVIHAMSKWVLCEACRFIKSMQLLGDSPTFVSVNLSVREFEQVKAVAHVAMALRYSGLDARLLHLEIPESVAGRGEYQPQLRDLNALGVKLVIGDLGAGSGSLQQLADAPVKLAKIDRRLIAQLGTNPEAESMLNNMIRLSRSLGIQVTALGVETYEQVEKLRGLGCTAAQGFYFSQPLSAYQVRDGLELPPV